ncbi:helix-turn-helix transcriptional regulator [Fulvivirgaceae bacterium BMA12]|uniref:Helix-turn-helix transcriptional regulator n=1 Tax=Agaribacillus aureus TaxID=3051825 RepID=A0ABT8LAR8_9BACT|nr:helix-turn-helix transcriptional regulator [Fulvivirgaceae bacterium BMA12]
MTTKGKYIGEFEEMVLLTVGILENEAYGISIKHKLEESTHRSVSMGALHSALHRLEEKQYLTSRLGDATKVRGGKRKRFYKVSLLGQQAVSDLMKQRQKLWEAIPATSFSIRWNFES